MKNIKCKWNTNPAPMNSPQTDGFHYLLQNFRKRCEILCRIQQSHSTVVRIGFLCDSGDAEMVESVHQYTVARFVCGFRQRQHTRTGKQSMHPTDETNQYFPCFVAFDWVGLRMHSHIASTKAWCEQCVVEQWADNKVALQTKTEKMLGAQASSCLKVHSSSNALSISFDGGGLITLH